MPHSPKHIPSRSYALDIPTVFVGAFSVRSSPFGAFARVGHTRFGRHRRADRRKLPSNMFGVSKVYNRVFHRPFSGYRLCVPNMPARLDDCNYLHNTATACGRRFAASRRERRSPLTGAGTQLLAFPGFKVSAAFSGSGSSPARGLFIRTSLPDGRTASLPEKVRREPKIPV